MVMVQYYHLTLVFKVLLFNFIHPYKNTTMKISRTRFVTTFLALAFMFQFATNSLLGGEMRLFPRYGEWYPGAESPTAWKNTVSAIIFPVKYVLVEPLSFLTDDPDAPPPILLIAFGLYWAAQALVLYYLFLFTKKIIIRKA